MFFFTFLAELVDHSGGLFGDVQVPLGGGGLQLRTHRSNACWRSNKQKTAGESIGIVIDGEFDIGEMEPCFWHVTHDKKKTRTHKVTYPVAGSADPGW